MPVLIEQLLESTVFKHDDGGTACLSAPLQATRLYYRRTPGLEDCGMNDA